MSDDFARKKDLGALHDLLLQSCPPDEDGVRSITILADELNLTTWAIYKWIKKGKLSAKRAKQIVNLDGCTSELDEFIPYLE